MSIETLDDLRTALIQAMGIEHTTIPAYITALYSIKPGTNLEAIQIIRTVAVEEMLHLTLAANVFNAVGGNIGGVLTNPTFVPNYPAILFPNDPDINGDIPHTNVEVPIQKFSRDAVNTFLQIEFVHEVSPDDPEIDPDTPINTIGLFYAQIIEGLFKLHQEMGEDLFSGSPSKQVPSDYYYNGAGDIIQVTDLDSAIKAIQMIQEQGEGSRQDVIYDSERALCHYYRFDQLLKGRYYVIDKDNPGNSDSPNNPTGEYFTVDWDSVYPIKENTGFSDLPTGTAVHTKAVEFQQAYHSFLGQLETCYNGSPETLIPAVHNMFKIRDLATDLIRNPIPGQLNTHASPVFSSDQS